MMKISNHIFSELGVDEVIILTSDCIDSVGASQKFSYKDKFLKYEFYIKSQINLKTGNSVPAYIGNVNYNNVLRLSFMDVTLLTKLISEDVIRFIISKKDVSLSEYTKLKLKYDVITK